MNKDNKTIIDTESDDFNKLMEQLKSEFESIETDDQKIHVESIEETYVTNLEKIMGVDTKCELSTIDNYLFVNARISGTSDIFQASIKACCYDNNMRFIGESECISCCIGVSTEWIFLEIGPFTVLDSGNYHVVVVGNGVPMARFKVEVSDDRDLISTEILTPTIDDLSFMLNRAEQIEGWRKYISQLEGFGCGRYRLLELLREQMLFDYRKMQNPELKQNVRHFIVSGEAPHAKKLLTLGLTHILSDSSSLSEYDASELLPVANINIYGKLDEMLTSPDTALLKGISALFNGDGFGSLTRLIKHMRDNNARPTIIIDCNRQELARLIELVPEIDRLIPEKQRFEFSKPTTSEAVSIISGALSERGMYLTLEAAYALLRQLKTSDTAFSERQLIESVFPPIVDAAERRISARLIAGETLNTWGLFGVIADDIQLPDVDNISFDEAMRPLMDMVGLDSLKSRLKEHFDLVRFNRLRRKAGLPCEKDKPLHMLFTGNPGTGKTTVAGYIGRIYKSLGLLSSGDVIRADRSRIVGEYIGQSEKNMTKLIEEARGNVLFIDEAYALCSDESDMRDFGRHALNVLLPHLSRPDSDMLVIFAGYDKDIERMLEMNQGLAGRFPQRFHFDDYTDKQLVEIAVNYSKQLGFHFDDKALDTLHKVVANALMGKDATWSNARWIEQFVDVGIRPAMSHRVLQSGTVDTYSLCTIQASDIIEASNRLSPKTKPTRRKVGFGY